MSIIGNKFNKIINKNLTECKNNMKKTGNVSNTKNILNINFVAVLKLSALVLFALVSATKTQVFSQKNDYKKFENQTILTIGEIEIPFSEIKKSYDKNSMKNGIPFEKIEKDSAKNFLDLYAKYRLKVVDGRAKGYDKDTTITSEIERNKRLLAESFLVEELIVEPNVKRFSEMRKVDKKIAMIMTNFNVVTGDTLEAFKKINSALSEIEKGADFGFAAKKYSADSITANNNGILPVHITGLKVQRNMENAIYNLKVGEYTKSPIKSSSGYFVIKLIDEKPREFINLSHILIPFKNDNAQLGAVIADSAAGKKIIDSLYEELKKSGFSNEKFNEIAKKYSSDKATAGKGGELGIYSRSSGFVSSGDNLVPEVEDAAYSLKDKQISQPVISQYGYHIVKRDSTIIYPENFEYDDIKSNYKRLYLQEDKDIFYDSLARTLCNYSLDRFNLNLLIEKIDTNKTALDTNLIPSIPQDFMQKTLFSLNNEKYTIEWFIKEITGKTELKLTPTNRTGLLKAIRKIIEPFVVETATKNIDKTHPQFNSIIEEFADGIILFKSETLNIWDKMQFDTLRAKQFYDTTSMDLTLPIKYDLTEIYVLSEEKANEIHDLLKSGKMTFEDAATEFTQRNRYRDKKGSYGFLNENHPLVAEFLKQNLKAGDYTKPFKYEKGFSIVKINEIQPERKRTFEEALSIISGPAQAEYQKSLEENWLKQLHNDYKVVINEELINEIYEK
jgi:peptidyl-prolyl cis-trans isomerase SurA